ncbi:endonuclease I [Dokdonella fugitiva]|uniref:Endonuclease I n=1 Tax=Dokdonella fugitiva TaxID=328517 RepID=A0A839F7V0_9GAMM|nr:endonuclease [Dokdonella fugitiva]MBA8889608.1 endonuclease I [Dokdonella fugitiva]
MQYTKGAFGAALLLFLASAPAAHAQYVSLVVGSPALEHFDTLAATGTGSALPAGWHFVEAGTNANGTYAADTGSTAAGNTYSYGASGTAERALGVLRSGSLQPLIGAELGNDSSLVVNHVDVNYAGEQWRLGATGRSDRLDFQYSLDATSINDAAATWVDVDALDFASPNTSAAVGALDGNLAANRIAISGTIAGLSLAPGTHLWVRWIDADIAGAEDGLAIDDVQFAIAGDPPVDLPPAVTSTTPAAGASGVATGAVLGVAFSEAVTTTDPWYSISCSVSGTHTATVSGGPATYTLTPSSAFAANESCTWTILATRVSDVDGTPDPLAADYTVTFTTLDPTTAPPTVVSTEPANGATNVAIASDVRVTFSEPVTTSNAFALSCDASPIALDEAGSGAQRTLTPASVLPAGGSCTFTIRASGVHDLDSVAMTADVVVAFQVATGTLDGYYAHVNPSTPEQLRCSLHQTIKGHTVYPYSGSGTNTWTILEVAQQDPNDAAKMIDVYRNRSYTIGSDRAGIGSGITYNREHTWPNSLGFANSSLAAYTDTHMLWLSDTDQNASRGNKPYDDCTSGCTELTTEANNGVGGGSGTYPGNSNWVRSPDGNAGSFEVWNHRKGEMARAMFYMAIRYEGIAAEAAHDGVIPDLELTDNRSLIVITSNTAAKAYMGILATLLEWHLQDPPDAEEVARNDVIQSFQGNRNPFVDHPEWATRALFESSEPAVCEPVVPSDVIFASGFEAAP